MLFNNLRRWSGCVLRLCSVNFASLSKILRNNGLQSGSCAPFSVP